MQPAPTLPSKDATRMSRALIFTAAAGLLLGLVIAAAAGLLWYRAHNQSPIPKSLRQQAGFTVLYPAEPWAIQQVGLQYNPATKVLTVPVRNGTEGVSMTEQEAPDQFADIPEYYSQFTDKLNAYKRFDSQAGQVSLTKPEELKGTQVAVLYGKGTLLFAQPEHSLSNEEWRSFFDDMKSD